MPALAHKVGIYKELVEPFETGYRLASHLYSSLPAVTLGNVLAHAKVVKVFSL